MKKKALIHFITNYVTMNDVANACIAVGGRPIMAEAIEELEDIISKVDGLVLNMGTLSQKRLQVIESALEIASGLKKQVLLDPVGCGASNYRLASSLKLLENDGITILKCNTSEAKALVLEEIDDRAIGVDSSEMIFDKESWMKDFSRENDLTLGGRSEYSQKSDKDRVELGRQLYNKFSKGRYDFIVVITGEKDIIIGENHLEIEQGGSYLQQSITGTGCMLNACIMTCVGQVAADEATSNRGLESVIKGVRIMNQSSQRAENRLRNKSCNGTYKTFLLDELSLSNKLVYLVTDEKLDFKQELMPKTTEALKAGLKILQYRAKNKEKEIRLKEALTLNCLAKKYGAMFIVNDDVWLAKEVMADGVHLGQGDMDLQSARKVLGHQAVIGATAKTREQALKAVEEGANYLGVGALFPSPTKKDAIRITENTLKEIKKAVSIPVYGIGGITPDNLTKEICGLVDGLVVVSCIYREEVDGEITIKNVMEELYEKLES